MEKGVKLNNEHWHKSVSKLVETGHAVKVTIMESTMPNNKPEIIICGNGEGTCMFIDIAISGERN